MLRYNRQFTYDFDMCIEDEAPFKDNAKYGEPVLFLQCFRYLINSVII